jgi:hypothetical protein
VVIVGIEARSSNRKFLFELDEKSSEFVREVENISPYLLPSSDAVVYTSSSAADGRAKMIRGNMPNDGGFLVLKPAC